jgi:hypothetical protein
MTAVANYRGESPCAKSGKSLRPVAAVMAVVQAIWPRKTAAELVVRTGRSERMCQYWLSRKYDLSVDDLAALLRSDEGLQILEALMGDKRPAWWRGFRRQVEIAELRRRTEQSRRRLEALELESAE